MRALNDVPAGSLTKPLVPKQRRGGRREFPDQCEIFPAERLRIVPPEALFGRKRLTMSWHASCSMARALSSVRRNGIDCAGFNRVGVTVANAISIDADLVQHVRAHVAHVRSAAARCVGRGGQLDVSIDACTVGKAGATVAYRAELRLASLRGGLFVRVQHIAGDAHGAVDGAFTKLRLRIAMASADGGHAREGLGNAPAWAPHATRRRQQVGARGRRVRRLPLAKAEPWPWPSPRAVPEPTQPWAAGP